MFPRYEARYTRHFEKCLQKHRDKKKRVKTLVERMLQHPYNQSHLLNKKRGIDLRGKRSRHLGSGNFCILYMICEECINNGFRDKGYNDCPHCTGQPLKMVIFLAFDKHDDIYAREWNI